MQPDEPQHPWSRLPAESPQAYAAFTAYKDFGPRRSLDQVAAAGRREGDEKATPGHLARWSARHRWVERAAAWDDHLQAERDREAARWAQMWERRRRESLEGLWQDGQRLQAKARELLRHPATRPPGTGSPRKRKTSKEMSKFNISL